MVFAFWELFRHIQQIVGAHTDFYYFQNENAKRGFREENSFPDSARDASTRRAPIAEGIGRARDHEQIYVTSSVCFVVDVSKPKTKTWSCDRQLAGSYAKIKKDCACVVWVS